MQKIMKYNPSFLTDDEIIKSFVVRQNELNLLLETIAENNQRTNQHMLIVGARGSGKTTLLRRTAAAIRENSELNATWFPLPFGEECYEVASAGQFWHEALHYLGVQTGDPKWAKAYNELLQEPDEVRLGQRALALLLDFADSQKKRIVIMIENLDLVLGEQLSEDDAWALRKVLMAENRIMLLGSAVTRFDAIIQENKAMFELFRIMDLSRLSVSDCQAIWKNIAGKDIHSGQARAIQILTGGSPRLLTVLAIFGADRSFNNLLEDLSLLVDEHTDYFKSNFEHLPSTERKVFACLATLWQDSTAAEVAKAARMTTSQVSSLLKRLVTRGVVEVLEGKKKKYQLSERLYNIYYLMRRGHENHRVYAVVNFMLHFYGSEKLHEAFYDIAQEVCNIEGDKEKHFIALEYLLSQPNLKKQKLFELELPANFFELNDIPEAVKSFTLKPQLIENAAYEGRWSDAVTIAEEILKEDENLTVVWYFIGLVKHKKLNQPKEALPYLYKAVELDPNLDTGWAKIAEISINIDKNYKEGISCLKKALDLAPNNHAYWFGLGMTLYLEMVEIVKHKNDIKNTLHLYKTIEEQGKEGEKAYRQALKLCAENPDYMFRFAMFLMLFFNTSQDILCIKEAITLISSALALDDKPEYHAGAVLIYIKGKDKEKVFEHLKKFINTSKSPQDITHKIIGLMRRKDFADVIIKSIENSNKLMQLEPLITAIKLYLEHEVQAPQEVREIAKDILVELKRYSHEEE